MHYRKSLPYSHCLLVVLLVQLGALGEGHVAAQQTQGPSKGLLAANRPLQTTAIPFQLALPASSQPKPLLQTPFQRLLEPHLRQMLAARPNAQPKPGASLQSHPLSNGSPSSSQQTNADPNFGGFLAAPSYATGAGLGQSSIVVDFTNDNPVVATLAADVNKDGFPDLIAVQQVGAISVLLNNGHGGFAAPVIYTGAQTAGAAYPPEFLYAVATDVNHDGYPDLIVQDGSGEGGNNENNELWVFLNQGNGTFAAPIQIKGGQCGFAGFAVGDVTGDGNPDIVALNGCGISTFAGDGQGHFNTSNVPTTNNPAALVGMLPGVAQLQLLAGKLNLVFASVSNDSVIGMPSNGDGTFGSANTLTIGGYFQFQDVNGDGIPDIILSNGDGNLYVALGESNGSFQPPVSAVGGYTAVYPFNFALVDVNGDNLPDFIDLEDGYASIYLNNGNGTFGGPSGIAAANYTTSLNFALNYESNNLAVADFNADGKIDFATVDYFYSLASIYFGNGNGSFQGASQIAENTPTPSVPDLVIVTAALDVNGDGKQDILGADEGNYAATGVLQIQSGISDGKGGFTYKTALSGSSIYNLEDILAQTGDFNGDGLQDIILYSETSTGAPVVSVSLSNGDGTFQHPVVVQLPNSPASLPANVAVGDVNGDGKQDLVFAYEGDAAVTGEVASGVPSGYYVALGNGDGTFQSATFTAYGGELYLPLLADVNGDGNLDLILADDPVANLGTYPFQVTILLGNGKGGFSSASPLTINTGNLIQNAFVSDLNRDGKPDLVLFTSGQEDTATSSLVPDTEGVLTLLGNGDGTFSTSPLLAQGIEPVGGAVADFNGDGIPDIVFSLYSDVDNTTGTYYGVSTLLGNGDGTFTQPANMNTLVFPMSDSVLTGNFLGDNTLGVVVGGYGFGSALLLNQGGTSVTLSAAEPTVNAGEEETLTATVTPTAAPQLIPTGTVTFLLGTTVLGQASLSDGTASLDTSDLPIGTDAITVSYSGDSTFNAYVNAASQNVTVAPALTTTTVNASPDPAAPGAAVTLQATVASAASGTATGSVTFYDGGTQLGTGSLTNGAATYTTSSLAAGNHSITAVYSGDSNFTGSTSAPITELIEAGAISLSVNPVALTMTGGQTGTVTLTVGANAAYSGSVSLSASGVPVNTVVSFSTNSITLASSQTQQVTITIGTNVKSAATLRGVPGWMASGGVISLAGLCLILLPRKRRRLPWMVVLVAAALSAAALTALSGCGGGPSSASPEGTSVVTITATPSGSGAAAQTTLNLIIQ